MRPKCIPNASPSFSNASPTRLPYISNASFFRLHYISNTRQPFMNSVAQTKVECRNRNAKRCGSKKIKKGEDALKLMFYTFVSFLRIKVLHFSKGFYFVNHRLALKPLAWLIRVATIKEAFSLFCQPLSSCINLAKILLQQILNLLYSFRSILGPFCSIFDRSNLRKIQ